jgi:hypothetical protein
MKSALILSCAITMAAAASVPAKNSNPFDALNPEEFRSTCNLLFQGRNDEIAEDQFKTMTQRQNNQWNITPEQATLIIRDLDSDGNRMKQLTS